MKKNIPRNYGQNAAIVASISTEDLDFQPFDDLVLLEMASPDRTEAGVIIPEQARESHFPRWKVAAVGPGRVGTNGTPIPMRLAVGDEVLVSPTRGSMFEVPGRTVKTVLASEGCVIAKVQAKPVLQ